MGRHREGHRNRGEARTGGSHRLPSSVRNGYDDERPPYRRQRAGDGAAFDSWDERPAQSSSSRSSRSSASKGAYTQPMSLSHERYDEESTAFSARNSPARTQSLGQSAFTPSSSRSSKVLKSDKHSRPVSKWSFRDFQWTRKRVIAAAILVPLLLLMLSGTIDGVLRVSRVRAEASDGMQHLKNIQAMVPAKGDYSALLTTASLSKVHSELVAAEQDFSALRMDMGGGSFAVGAHAPFLGGTVSSAQALAGAADEACLAGMKLTDSGQILLTVLKSGFFAQPDKTATQANTPEFNEQTIATLKASFDDAFQHLDAAMTYAQQADLSTLPSSLVKPSQLSMLKNLVANWPNTRQQLAQADGWLSVAPFLLGAKNPTHLLLVMMDRTELRPTGGFMGNYAVATIQRGKVLPFSLTDTYLLDYPYFGRATSPLTPPDAYASWWPYGNFALRDSNLSGDFPTSAKLALHELQIEGGGTADGMVAFTPAAIGRIITVVGNISVPEYGEVVTPTNLEAIIHKYQQILAMGKSETNRKAFTALLAQHLIQKLHGLPPSKLVKIGQEMSKSLHSKDIQIYFANADAEKLLATTGYDGSLAHGPGDGVSAIDANVGFNKANLFVTVQYTDSVSLDAHGTATHNLTITYNMRGGQDDVLLFHVPRYLTYLRMYTPPNAKLLHQDGLRYLAGFSCTGSSPNQINQTDFPGRQMWGGCAWVPDDSSYSLHLTWSVENAATRDSSGKWLYLLNFQHQAGSNQSLNLTVTVAGSKQPLFKFNGPLIEDEHVKVQYGGNG